jgi:hypothetical protein
VTFLESTLVLQDNSGTIDGEELRGLLKDLLDMAKKVCLKLSTRAQTRFDWA